MHKVQQELVETKARLKLEQKNAGTATLKLEHVEKVATQRIVESISGANFDEDSKHLVLRDPTLRAKFSQEFNQAPQATSLYGNLKSRV